MMELTQAEQLVIKSWYRANRDEYAREPADTFSLGEHELNMEQIKLAVILARMTAVHLENACKIIREVEELWWHELRHRHK